MKTGVGGAFEGATKVAIAEIIQNHAQESKFGYVLSQEGFQDMVSELYELLATSRTLKTAGDRFLSQAFADQEAESSMPGQKRRMR